jgi:hypothetical protein
MILTVILLIFPYPWYQELRWMVCQFECIWLQLQMDHNVVYNREIMITRVIYSILPPAYQTTSELIKHNLNHQVADNLFQHQLVICQMYGQLQQQKHLGHRYHQWTEPLFLKNNSLFSTFPKKSKLLWHIGGRMAHKVADCWDHPNNKDKDYNLCFYKRSDQTCPPRSNFSPTSHSTNNAAADATTEAP